MKTDEQKKSNRRLGLILASVALVFFMGFVGKMVLLGG
ncbi:MAG: cytochrome oxidase small assembly protein [Hydrogenophaga sp.]